MLIKRTKLQWFKGKQFVDLRSYEVESHLKRNATARIVYGDEYMDLSPARLKRWTVIDPEPFNSKINAGQVYYLYSYVWKPKGKISLLTKI